MTEPAPTRVLVVEDEPVLAGTVATYLDRAGHATRTCDDGLRAVREARDWRPDVIVLDLGLPGLDGIEVCRQVRTFSDCYVLMLTARSDEVDTLVGLSVGADDYMTKPFSPRELVARVGVLLRRPRATALAGQRPRPGGIVVGDLVVQPDAREVSVDGDPVELTRTEFDLLAALADGSGRVLTRRQLSDAVWGGAWAADDHLVDVHIAHLRHKLGDDAATGRIQTVRGVGYRLDAR